MPDEYSPSYQSRWPGGISGVAIAGILAFAIANADAAASPHTDAALGEAHRAIQEVIQRRAMPVVAHPRD